MVALLPWWWAVLAAVATTTTGRGQQQQEQQGVRLSIQQHQQALSSQGEQEQEGREFKDLL